MKKTYSGYIALTTSVIISVVMIMLAISLSSLSLFGRTNGVASLHKSKSLSAAEGCLEQALLNISLNGGYAGNDTVDIQIGGESINCTIAEITSQGFNRVIRVQARAGDATTNLRLIVNGATLSRVSLEETETL